MIDFIISRRFPVGAEVQSDGGVHFRVWAPRCRKVELIVEGKSRPIALAHEEDGYYSCFVEHLAAGAVYRYRLDGDDYLYPDPSSRYQPDGPHGPSVVIDPNKFRWSDQDWPGVELTGQIIYEMHIGTFTPAGNWAAAARELPELARLGITVIEVMPVAEFSGRFGWGYDGVDLFAPSHLYGEPDDLRRFVDQAHANGIAVILDVVYNHLGPDGNYLSQFSPDYFSKRYVTEWGDAINFDDQNSEPVREFFLSNAEYWISEFHFDGLRLDATQQIFDKSAEHIVAAIGRRVRAAAPARKTFIVAENEPQEVKLVQPCEQGGYGLDGLWNDDFHHSAMVALTGHNEAYYSDHLGKPQEFISAIKYGFLYQGQYYKWQKQPRGTPAIGLSPESLITFIQNHDQVANSGHGQRCHQLTSPGRYKAMTTLLLLAPGTPMLFQGQEFAASTPFLYFADHNPELAELVKNGRYEFLQQFLSLKTDVMKPWLADPGAEQTFLKSKLDLGEREKNNEIYALHHDLLALRRTDPVFRAPRAGRVDGAVLADEAFILRFFGEQGDDRILLINFGRDLPLLPAPEPLLAPPAGRDWQLLFSTEDPRYRGCGTAEPDDSGHWSIPGHAAIVFSPRAD